MIIYINFNLKYIYTYIYIIKVLYIILPKNKKNMITRYIIYDEMKCSYPKLSSCVTGFIL